MNPEQMPVVQDDDPVLAEGDGYNRKMRRQFKKAERQARKKQEKLLKICRELDVAAAQVHYSGMNKGKQLNQFEALIAIHKTRLTMPGLTEEESATSLAWLNEMRIPV